MRNLLCLFLCITLANVVYASVDTPSNDELLFSEVNQPLENDNRALILAIDKHRNEIKAFISENDYLSIKELIIEGDSSFYGFHWLSTYERLLVSLNGLQAENIEKDSALLERIWRKYGRGRVPNGLCGVSLKSMRFSSLGTSINLENLLWRDFKRKKASGYFEGKFKPDLSWIIDNHACNKLIDYDYLDYKEQQKSTKLRVKEFNNQFPESKYSPSFFKEYRDEIYNWSGNAFLFSLGADYTIFESDFKNTIQDGSSVIFGFATYFSQLYIGANISVRNFDLMNDYQFHDSLFVKGERVQLSHNDFIFGYPFKIIPNWVLTPYTGFALYTFEDLMEVSDKDLEKKYELDTWGHPFGLIADYTWLDFEENRMGEIAMGLGLRLGVQYNLTNLSNINSDFGDHSFSFKVEITGGFLGLNKNFGE